MIAFYHGVTSLMNFTNVGQIVSRYARKWSAVAACLSCLSATLHDTQKIVYALTQLATSWPLTTDDRVRSQAIYCGICGR